MIVEDMCYERRRAEACVRNPVLEHRVRLFSLVPLVWELNPKLLSRVAGARPDHQPIGGSDPNHQGIWSPPRAARAAKGGPCTVAKNTVTTQPRGRAQVGLAPSR